MKNLFMCLSLSAFILFCMCSFAHGFAAFNMDIEKYFCPKIPNSSYNFMDLYVPSDDCSSYKGFIPAYNMCIKKNKELKSRFDAGLCEKVLVYEHTMYEAICKAEVLEKSQTHISTKCSGKHTSRALRKVKKYYGDKDDYDYEYRHKYKHKKKYEYYD